MNTVTKISLILLMAGSSIVSAQDSVDAQIQEIKNAPQQERVRLMNQFKLRLSEMNQEDREAAVALMRKETLQSQSKNSDGDSQIRHRHQINQMSQVEQMNQVKAKEQYNTMGARTNGGNIQNPNMPKH